MKITINEVAKIAGVSKATISRVLNNSKPVSSEVKDRVMKVIAETGYSPNLLARGLATQETRLIGVVIPDITNPYFSELVKGIEEEANSKDYNILLCNSYLNHQKEIRYLNILKDKVVDGIIFMTTDQTKEQEVFFEKYDKAVITIGRSLEGISISSVDIDNFLSAYVAVNYLISLNHKRIGMVRGPLINKSAGNNRYEGYIKAIEQSGIVYDHKLIVEGSFSSKDGYNAMSRLLNIKNPPTAVFFANDDMAVGGISCIVSNGLKVPEDISVVGFDDIPIASIFIPSLTTIKQPIFEMGKSAVTNLIKKIKGKTVEKHKVFETELVIRNSTKMKNGEK